MLNLCAALAAKERRLISERAKAARVQRRATLIESANDFAHLLGSALRANRAEGATNLRLLRRSIAGASNPRACRGVPHRLQPLIPLRQPL